MFVYRANPMLEAGVKISTLPVGVGVDSSLRMLAWGCRRSNPGGSRPSLHPPFVPSGGVRTNIIQLRKQNAKRSIIEVRENVCFACTEEVIPSSTR